ncbi:MAG TPA: YsnF/AvaK domain-containing protein [Polyangiaceae bacterium]|nr:YsnF/AvaK domain-containing protein [Polyangiaceae bacterium]
MRTVIGLFGNAGEARRAIDELQGLGYSPDKISVVTNVASQDAIQARKAMALQSLELTDVGNVATAGPLRDVFAKQPGFTGALGSALQLFGLTPELAEHYVSGVKHGETLESLTVDDKDSDRVLAVMRRRTANPAPAEEEAAPLAGAGASASAGAGPIASAGAGAGAGASIKKKTNGHIEMDDREEERVIPIVREEMRVGRRTVERGGVRVSSHIVQKPVSEQVHLRETHVDIERRAVDRPLRGDEKAFVDDTIEMVEMADEPVVSKQARVVEEVVVRKHVEDRTATISDKVRATEIEFGKLRAFDPEDYRGHFESQKIGGSFEPYLPAYQFGHELHRRKAAERWEDVEGYARDRWEEDNPGTWDKFRGAILHAWSHARAN